MPTPYEREIEEILRNLGDLGPRETSGQRLRRLMRLRWQRFCRGVADLPRSIPPDQLMLGALLFVVAAYFLRYVLPSVARFVGLAGLVLFAAAFIISFNHLFGGPRRDLRWRGQPIDMRRREPTLIDRFILWLRRRMRGY